MLLSSCFSLRSLRVGLSSVGPRRGSACRAVAPVETAPKPVPTELKREKAQVLTFNNVEFVVEDDPDLKSTWGQRAIVGSSTVASALLLGQGVAHCDNPLAISIAMLFGFIFADLGSGIYHWSVDNYGSGDTPIVGSQIAAFQGHHKRPWTITQREFCNNCSLTFKPAGIAAVLFLALSATGGTSGTWDTFAATAIFFIAMSQQLHAWSHMRKSELPTAVLMLQDAGVFISRRAHGQHHRSPFNEKYCIVSGWCNPLLDSGIMYSAEQVVKSVWGVEPRGWSEPTEEWREQAPPGQL